MKLNAGRRGRFIWLRRSTMYLARVPHWLGICLLVVGCSRAQETPAAKELAAGGWIGWAYIGEGGDLPLRVWVSEGDDRPRARFDGVPWKQSGWPAELHVDGDSLVLALETPKGTPIRLNGTLTKEHWVGSMKFGKYAGDFELMHAPGLADISPDDYADVPGYYRMSDGDVLEARALDWGEIVVRSIRTGEQRTLLPTGTDAFMTGPARYVPTPLESHYKVIRGGDGAIVELVREDASGSTSHGEPFQLHIEDATIESGGVKLAGTITRPDDNRSRPGVVVLGGSSWETRETYSFQARNLAAIGFTVIHWDKRGFGESGGSDPVPFSTTADDAVAAAKLLRQRDDVSRVGYFGGSRGGWFAPLAISRDDDASFLILFVPPATSPARQEQDSRLARMREDGYSDADVTLAEKMLKAAWRFIETDTDDNWAQYDTLLAKSQLQKIPDYVFPPDTRDPDQWRWARMNMLYDPFPALEQIRIPILAVFGENDLNVLTSVNRPLMIEALQRAGNNDVEIVTVPGVPHNLARQWGERHHRTTGIGPEGFDEVLAWSREHELIP